jgi:uncharacterized membrane protein YtjA (UPF0391 family)
VGIVLRRIADLADMPSGAEPIAAGVRRGQTGFIASASRLRSKAVPSEIRSPSWEVVYMLHYAVVFFIIALVAALFGFGGLAAGAAGIAKILFVLFIMLAIGSFLLGVIKR